MRFQISDTSCTGRARPNTSSSTVVDSYPFALDFALLLYHRAPNSANDRLAGFAKRTGARVIASLARTGDLRIEILAVQVALDLDLIASLIWLESL